MADIKGIRGKASWRCLSNRMSAEVNVFSVVNSINIKPEKSVINIVKAQTIVWDNLHEKPGFGIKIYRSIVTVYWIQTPNIGEMDDSKNVSDKRSATFQFIENGELDFLIFYMDYLKISI